jgi:hypothetical protein
MKYECLEKQKLMHDDIPITVKLLMINGQPQQRYFIYDKHHITTCGGAGWKDVIKMIGYYKWYIKQPTE